MLVLVMNKHASRIMESTAILKIPADAQVDTAASVITRLGATMILRSVTFPSLDWRSNPLSGIQIFVLKL